MNDVWESVPLSFKFNVFLVFYLNFLSCLELAKHNIFVLTVDCSLKKKWQRKTWSWIYPLVIWFLLGCIAMEMLFWFRVWGLKGNHSAWIAIPLSPPFILSTSAYGCLCECLSLNMARGDKIVVMLPQIFWYSRTWSMRRRRNILTDELVHAFRCY